jgi:hypothetical protein
VLGGGAALLAALAPPPATTRPIATEPPTTTPPPLPTATPIGQLVVDDFSQPGGGFAVIEHADGSVAYAEGKLRMVLLVELLEWISLSRRVDTDNVTVEVDVTQVSGPDRNEMAVLCRYQPDDGDTPIDDERFVALAISGEGEYAIWQKRDGERTYLVEWTAAPGLTTGPGAPHHLTASCQDDRLLLEADGQVLAETTDPAPTSGDVALMAGLRAEGQLVVEFDNVIVTE